MDKKQNILYPILGAAAVMVVSRVIDKWKREEELKAQIQLAGELAKSRLKVPQLVMPEDDPGLQAVLEEFQQRQRERIEALMKLNGVEPPKSE